MGPLTPIPFRCFVDGSTAEVEQLEPGIRRQILGQGPDLMLCRVWFDTGTAGAVHSHPHSQSTFVESGRFQITIDGVTRELAAGDACYVAPYVEHGAACVEAGVLIDAFSPARADFLAPEG
jgi:quercetin dioxygenase-like cupin family protein